jgi:hypothetical protein
LTPLFSTSCSTERSSIGPSRFGGQLVGLP